MFESYIEMNIEDMHHIAGHSLLGHKPHETADPMEIGSPRLTKMIRKRTTDSIPG